MTEPEHVRGGTAAATLPRNAGLSIDVVAAVGYGNTLLSSFDDALRRCGAHNYNLLMLSSVIPPGSTVEVVDRRARPEAEFGRRLYVVKAEARTDRPGTVAVAGLGWVQWGDGRGVFVEATLESKDALPESVEARLFDTLRTAACDLCLGRGVTFDIDAFRVRLAVGRAGRQPTTALVLAVYQSEDWR